MIKKYHNSISGRLAAALLLMLGIIGLAGLPAMAEGELSVECQSPLTNEIHTYDPGLDKSMCPEPIADFCAYPREGCDSLMVMFTDLSQGYIDTWSWDFGDPSSGADNFSNEENPSHLYRSTGLYTITLTVVGPGGTDTETKEHFIRVKTTPVADFEFSMLDDCRSTTVNFTDLSIWADTWYWTFGDGAYSTEQNPTHTYSSAGTYIVTLKAYNECGRDVKIREVIITTGAQPVADFTSDITSGCESAEVSFYDRSTYATSWHWDFGDGATSDEQNPKHTYTAVGKYTVSLTVSNECGEDTATKYEYITILSKPIADFTSDVIETCVGAEVQFTDLSLYAVAWWWDFGDGTSSTEQNPIHSYQSPGVYTVTLKAYNECGRDMKIKELYITVHPRPIADFTSDITEGCAGATINFTDQSQYADTWEWDFGDGATSHDQNPSHTYNSAGYYTVTLKVSNDCGEDEETKVEYVTIYPEPIADFSSDVTSTCVGGTIHFTDMSNYAESWNWDFGDGETSDDRNPSHTYNAAGTYTVTLTIKNRCGDDDEVKVDYIRIYPEPTAEFTSEIRETCAGETISFIDRSSYALVWSWDFGDGLSSNEQNPSHTYTTAGIYTVSLTVQNPCGGDDTVMVDYVTIHPKPTADFTSDNVEGCVGTDISFTSLTTNADSVRWYFGDGGESDEANPSHTYTKEGTYTVKLTAYNSCGSDEEIKEEYIKIYSGPTADFTADILEGCQGMTVAFTNLSTGSNQWSWDFGDGATSSEQNPSHTYNMAGKFTVSLKSSNSCGDDTETKTDYIIVHQGPLADFSATPRSGERPLTVDFTDLSTSPLGIKSWSWDFGDSETSTERNPQHIYATPGTYSVTLTVTDDCGKDSESKEEYIYVIDTCKIDFTYEPSEGCAPLLVSFNGTTTGPCEIGSWTWDFGDPTSGSNNTATGRIVTHTYNTPGKYTVKLTGEDYSGTKVITKTDCIAVYGKPSAAFTAAPMEGVAPLLVHFDDISNANGSSLAWAWDFGDPSSGNENTSDLQNTGHVYDVEGTYTVTLITTNDCGKDTASAEIIILPPLTITKTVDKAITFERDTLLYTLTIENASDYAIGNLFVIDSIPDSTAYIDGSVTGGGWHNDVENQMNWSIVSIAAGGAVELSFKVVLDGPFTVYPTIVSNKAYATIYEDVAKPISSRTFVSNVVQTTVDKITQLLEISKEVSATLAYPGDILTYTITVTNRNLVSANNVVIYDAIPELTSYVAGSISAGGIYYPATDSLIWNIGTLNPFESRAVSFGVTINTGVPNGQKIPNTALVRSSSGDNQSNMVITAVSLTPIVVTKTANRPSGMIGDLVRYTITVENYSGDLFVDVQLTDTLPGGIFYVKGSSLLDGTALADPNGDNPIVWSLGDLPASGTVTVEYTALIGTSAHP
ncbi:MAG: PKD domain-containing protein, partial [Candidatus Zixiibacteriota bacterium]